MYKLFWREGTGAFAPQALLEEIGVSYEKVRVATREKANFEPWFLAINPLAQIPVLQLPGGEVLTESSAIMLYLADRHPEAGLAPHADAPERARYLRWMMFAAANLYMTLLRVHYPERQAQSEAGIAEALAVARARNEREWTLLDEALGSGPFVLGDTYSAVDPYLFMLWSWHDQPEALLGRCRNLRRLVEACLQRPVMARLWPIHNIYGNV